VLDKAEYSAFESTLNSSIVSYRIVWCDFQFVKSVEAIANLDVGCLIDSLQ